MDDIAQCGSQLFILSPHANSTFFFLENRAWLLCREWFPVVKNFPATGYRVKIYARFSPNHSTTLNGQSVSQSSASTTVASLQIQSPRSTREPVQQVPQSIVKLPLYVCSTNVGLRYRRNHAIHRGIAQSPDCRHSVSQYPRGYPVSFADITTILVWYILLCWVLWSLEHSNRSFPQPPVQHGQNHIVSFIGAALYLGWESSSSMFACPLEGRILTANAKSWASRKIRK